MSGITPAPGAGNKPVILHTYAELYALASANKLIVGQLYEITDFTTYYQIPYTSDFHRGSIEPLLLEAISPSNFSTVIYSTIFPTDVLHYKLIDDTGAGGDKGIITYREDTIYNIKLNFDWRNTIYRRGLDSVTGAYILPTNYSEGYQDFPVFSGIIGEQVYNVNFLHPLNTITNFNSTFSAECYDNDCQCNFSNNTYNGIFISNIAIGGLIHFNVFYQSSFQNNTLINTGSNSNTFTDAACDNNNYNGCQVESNIVINNGQMNSNIGNTSNFSSNTIDNSFLNENVSNNGGITDNVLSNSSKIFGNVINAAGSICICTLSSGTISSNTLTNSTIQGNTLTDSTGSVQARIDNNVMYDSYIVLNVLVTIGIGIVGIVDNFMFRNALIDRCQMHCVDNDIKISFNQMHINTEISAIFGDGAQIINSTFLNSHLYGDFTYLYCEACNFIQTGWDSSTMFINTVSNFKFVTFVNAYFTLTTLDGISFINGQLINDQTTFNSINYTGTVFDNKNNDIKSLGIGVIPTAQVHTHSSDGSQGSAPIKLTTGALMAIPEVGAFEYDGNFLYFTDATGIRKIVTLTP